MVSSFHWKLIIAGSVGGACAFFSSVLVFAILVCRHQRKLKRRAAKRTHHRRASTQHSHSTDPSELARGFKGTIGSADLPLPIPPDVNYVQPAFGVGPFWMGQNSINHDSGCADLESNRTDSASYGQRSFSPLPRTLNGGHAARTFPADTFPAMSSFDIDSDLSHSFDLLSPPVLNFGFRQSDAVHTSARPSNQRILGSSNMSPSDHVWRPHKCRSSDNNTETSYLESRGRDSSLQLVELAHSNGYLRSQCPSGQASMLSSSDDDDPIWIRRTSVQPDSTLTQSMVNHSNSDPSSVWLLSEDRSRVATVSATRDPISRHAVTSRTTTAFDSGIYQRNAFSNPSRNDVRKQNGFMNPHEAYGCVYPDFSRGGTISN